MNRRLLFILLMGMMAVVPVWAQQVKRTVTNADLEKYRQQRLQSEADYRANYQKRGMPSPEELKELEIKRQAQLAQDAARIRATERAEYEAQLEAEELQRQRALTNAQINYWRSQTGNSGSQSPVIFGSQMYGGGIYYGGNPRRRGGVVYRQTVPVAPNVQTVRNAASRFPTVTEMTNQIYGNPPRPVINRGRGGRRP